MFKTQSNFLALIFRALNHAEDDGTLTEEEYLFVNEVIRTHFGDK